MAAFTILALLASIVIERFASQEPSINEVQSESLETEWHLPDVAITVGQANLTEGQLLDYMRPEFIWVDLRNGA